MIKIAICDDEKYIRDYLAALIHKQGCDTEITQYASADAYLSDDAEYDMLFLDIELEAPSTCCPDRQPEQLPATGFPNPMDGMNQLQDTKLPTPKDNTKQPPYTRLPNHIDGMELARRIRNMESHRQPLILFVTGHERYVYDAFDVDAFQYLIKPVDENRFAEIFRRAAARLAAKAEQQKKLAIQCAGTTRVLPLDSIYYIESQGHKILLHLKDTTVEYYARLGDLEHELERQFCRIHKGFLVNLAYVEEYSRSQVILTNGVRLNLSKYKYDGFVKAHLRFIREA